MENVKNIKCIDIGCGMPHQKYSNCIGIDLNSNYDPDILHNCDEGLPFDDDSISFINSDNSLEHFKNPYFVLSECYRVLINGGEMRLIVPNCQWLPLIFVNLFLDLDWVWHQWMNSPFKRGRGVHWSFYTKFLITKILQDVGFKIKHRKGFLYSKEITIIAGK
ncbi:MAG: class I SAM-dependent methyltransferase [Bacteroidetes bacterium]|nr:class I SAM-dependent methyltransferase [Bacteroidota bacterium]